MVERINGSNQCFFLISGSSYEILAGQFQKLTDRIVCVKDGCQLNIYNSGSQIPQYLSRSYLRHDDITNVTRYSYRSITDESLYTFFDHRVDTWLISNRRGDLTLTIIDQGLNLRQDATNVENKQQLIDQKQIDKDPDCSIDIESLSGRMIKIDIKPSAEIVIARIKI